MDKRENGFWIASVSLVGAIILFAIVFLSIDYGLGIRGTIGNASYDDFLLCLRFQYPRPGDIHLIMGTVVFYLGIVLFFADALFVVLKRVPRYIGLSLAGFLAFTVCTFLIQNLTYAHAENLPSWYYGLTFAGVIITAISGLGAFVVTFVFGRKLLKKDSD